MRITIIGTGTWGTALAQVLADNGHPTLLYGKDIAQINDINNHHRNRRYFDESVTLSTAITATDNLHVALEQANIILLAVPSFAVRNVLQDIAEVINKKTLFINVAKGFDPHSKMRFSQLIKTIIPKPYYGGLVTLIGPSHAEEVIKRQLTLISATAKKVKLAETVSNLFANTYFRVYIQRDEIGAEVGGAIKNVIAIASGVITGLKLGDNARAALVTRGLAEMMRLGKVLGGKFKTYTGLTGLGDLMVTCYSSHSRNYQAGVKIGQANSAEQFLKENKTTVEGIPFAKIAYEIGKKFHLSLPIIESVYAVLYEQKRPSDLIKGLMNRPLKVE